MRQVLQSDWLSFRTLFSDLYTNIKGVHAGDCTYLNNRKILCGGRNTRAPRTATT